MSIATEKELRNAVFASTHPFVVVFSSLSVRQSRELVGKLQLRSSVRSFNLPCDSCGKVRCKCEGEASGSRKVRNGIFVLQTTEEHGHHRYKHGLVEPYTGLPVIPVHGIPKEGQSNGKDPDDDIVDCMVSFLMQDPANELNVSDPNVRFQRMHAVCTSFMFFANDTARVTRLIPRAYTEAQTILIDRRIANIENEVSYISKETTRHRRQLSKTNMRQHSQLLFHFSLSINNDTAKEHERDNDGRVQSNPHCVWTSFKQSD